MSSLNYPNLLHSNRVWWNKDSKLRANQQLFCGDAENIEGDISSMYGDISNIRGNCSGISVMPSILEEEGIFDLSIINNIGTDLLFIFDTSSNGRYISSHNLCINYTLTEERILLKILKIFSIVVEWFNRNNGNIKYNRLDAKITDNKKVLSVTLADRFNYLVTDQDNVIEEITQIIERELCQTL